MDTAPFLWTTDCLWKALWKTACGCETAQAPVTSTPTVALTSGCSRIWTLYGPAVLIGSGTTIFRRSISGPPAARTASAMSAGADRAEQPAVRARPPLEPDVQPLQLAGHRLGVLEGADLAGRAGPLDQVDLLLPAARPADREPAGHQVVAAVARGHVHDVAGGAEAVDLLGQDQLHRETLVSPPLP